jgi:molecular chaperone IbpA
MEDIDMRNFDLAPLQRFSVGFDHINRLLETASKLDATANSYPPYNIEQKSEDEYKISMAVAGFSEEELDITLKENTLYVMGNKESREEEKNFLHKGIATRSFERNFELASHIKVVNAELNNGLLDIDLVREIPEEKKPRTIVIVNKSAK